MEKVNIRLRKEDHSTDKSYRSLFRVEQIQGRRCTEIYQNSSEQVGDAYVLREGTKVFDAKNLETPREEIDKQLYNLARKVAEEKLKKLTPEIIDKTLK